MDPVFFSQFLSWRAWVLKSSEEDLQFFLGKYGKQFGLHRRQRLAKLIEDLRRDRVQIARNREWLLLPGAPERRRIESNHWNPETDWQFLATDLWVLGRLHAEIGEPAEAMLLLERALIIWRTHGHKLPHVQLEAIPQLEALISRLAPEEWRSSTRPPFP